jgi:hypothetical protein
LKKAKALRIKQEINKNFKHLKKLPKTNFFYTQIIFGDYAKCITTKTVINGEFIEEGCACNPSKNIFKAIQAEKETINKILKENKLVYVRKYPHFKFWGDNFAIRCRLAH